MAHSNIDERRAYVANLLQDKGTIGTEDRKKAARLFGCTTSAIYADILSLTRKTTIPAYTSNQLRQIILERDNRTCQYCGGNPTSPIIVEHVIPHSRGGVGRDYNLVAACSVCNVRKRSSVWIPKNIDVLRSLDEEWYYKILEMSTLR